MKKLLLLAILFLLIPNVGFAATWNPSDKAAEITLSGGDLTAAIGTAAWAAVRVTSFSGGKWYWENYIDLGDIYNCDCFLGLLTSGESLNYANYANSPNSWAYYGNNGKFYNNGTGSAVFATYTTDDIVMVAYDTSGGKVWFGKNGTWSGDPGAGTGEAYSGLASNLFPYFGGNILNDQITTNFGASAFTYTVPSGFCALDGCPAVATPTSILGLVKSFWLW